MLLNEEQKAAVEYVDGPQVIVAGPGSGKTRVIISKIQHLVTELGTDPSRILAITFSSKAAEEMTDRLAEAFPYRSHEFNTHTFHALCWNLVQEFSAEAGFKSGVQVLDKTAAWVLVRRHIENLGLRHFLPNSDPFKHIFDLLGHVSRAKDEGVTPAQYEQYAADQRKQYESDKATLTPEQAEDRLIQVEKCEELARFYTRYQQLLRSENCIDFGDQIAMALALLTDRPDIRRQVQGRWDYILVDEFQDTNIAQIELLKLLTNSEARVCVVGDPDQSIYRFRGASYASFTRFDAAYDVRHFALTRNYRSTGNVLTTAAQLISNNQDRYVAGKPVWTENQDGDPVLLIKAPSFTAEAEAVADEIVSLLSTIPEEERRFSDFAILYRAHGHREEFAAALDRRGIPYRVIGGAGFYSKEEIKDICALIKTAADREDGAALHRVLSLQDWLIPASALKALTAWMNAEKCGVRGAFDRLAACPDLTPEACLRVHEAFEFLINLKTLAADQPASEVCRHIFDNTQLLKRYLYDDTIDARQRSANLAKYLRKVHDFEEASEDKSTAAFAQYQDYLLESGADDEEAQIDDTRDAVQLMTVHAAKGLEWPYVFVVCLSSARFPTSRRSENVAFPDDLVRETLPQGDFHIGEERRLAYVALTRAQKRLYLSCVEKKGKKPSVFVHEVGVEGAPIVERQAPEVTFNPAIESTADLALAERNIRRRIMHVLDQSTDIQRLQPYVELLAAVRQLRSGSPIDVVTDALPAVDPALRESIQNTLDDRLTIASVNFTIPPEPLYLSYSRISTYEDCPLAYKFSYELKIPGRNRHYFSFGNTVHTSLMEFCQSVQAGEQPSLDDLKSIYHKNWQSEGYVIKSQEDGYRRDGETALESFYRRYQSLGVVPLHLEWKFTLPVGGHFITGFVDRIDPLSDGACSVIDYKTGKPRTQKDVDSDLQLGIYAIAVRQGLGLSADQLSLYFLQSDEILTTTRTEEQLAEVEEKVLSVAESICARRFEPNPSDFKCGRCDYAGICPVMEG